MTTRWAVDCWNCGGEGDREGECACMDDTCCCAEPVAPRCDICKGKGFFEVTELTDDNCETAIPLD